jgi:hypothetical protein
MSRHVDNQPHDEVFNVSDEDGAGSESAESDDGGRALGKSADDDDFDFASEFGRGGEESSPLKGGKSKVVANQPFDEAVDLSASASDDGSSAGSSPHNPVAAAASRAPAAMPARMSAAPAPAPRAAAATMPKQSEQQRKALSVDVGKSSSPSEDGAATHMPLSIFAVQRARYLQIKPYCCLQAATWMRKMRRRRRKRRAAAKATATKEAAAYTTHQTMRTLM